MSSESLRNRVFILGSGFSIPAGLPSTQSLTSAVSAALMAADSAVQAALEFGRRAAVGSGENPSIEHMGEALLCDIELAEARVAVEGPESPIDKRLDEQRRRLNAIRLAVAAQIATSEPAPGSIPDYVTRFVSDLKPGGSDAVVTLNYDCVVENAMARLGLPYIYRADGEACRGAVPIYKLHGSRNWLAWSLAEEHGLDAQVLWRGREVVMELAGGFVGGPSSALYRVDEVDRLKSELAKSRSAFTAAGILLPASRKSVKDMPALGLVWALAGLALQFSGELVLVGTSLSDTDPMLRVLLARAQVLSRVVIVDSCPNPVADRLRRVLPSVKVETIKAGSDHVEWPLAP